MLYEDLRDIENGRCITKDGASPVEFSSLSRWQNKAIDLGYRLENNTTRGLWIAYRGNAEMGTYNPTKGGRLYIDNKTTDGGEGSGVKGHVTAKQLAAMQKRKAAEREMLKNKNVGPDEIKHVVNPVLRAIEKGSDPNKAFADLMENENMHGDKPHIVAYRNKIIAYMNKNHKANIDPEKVNKLL